MFFSISQIIITYLMKSSGVCWS